MKIVFATGTIERGGKERQLFILARYLREQGHEVKIVTARIAAGYCQEYGFSPASFGVYHAQGWLKRFRGYSRLVFSERPDVLVSWDFLTSLFSLLIYRKCRCCFLNFSIQHGIRLFKPSHLLRSLVCLLSPYVIANSRAGLKANNLRPGKRRFVLYNGIEDKFFNTLSKAEIARTRERLIPGFAQSPGTIYASIANFVPYKDYGSVLKAMAELQRRMPFYYFIIGDGPLRTDVEGKIREFDLQRRIILTGRVENVRDYLFASDILIHSSRGEGVSNAILEGMYAGLPVIASSVGGVPETVYPPSSLLFPYRDERAILDRLMRAHDAFSHFDPGSEEYLEHLRKYSVQTMTSRFEAILNESCR